MGNTHTASLDASYTIHMGNIWNSVNETLCWGSNCTPAWDTEAQDKHSFLPLPLASMAVLSRAETTPDSPLRIPEPGTEEALGR